jgi:hypothetical protein
MGALESRGQGGLMTEQDKSTGKSILRGCAIALGIAFLVLAFVVGACFLSL